MGDIRIENYWRSVRIVLARWERRTSEIARSRAELEAKVKKTGVPSGKDLAVRRAALLRQQDQANASLRLELMLVPAPPRDAVKPGLVLPGWIRKIIEAQGIPVGGQTSVAPLAFSPSKLGLLLTHGGSGGTNERFEKFQPPQPRRNAPLPEK